jgi:cbb3-type cytochrome oxidase maturation protein
MDILYLLIPLSVVLVLLILLGLWWAIHSGQFDRMEGEAERILRQDRSTSKPNGLIDLILTKDL